MPVKRKPRDSNVVEAMDTAQDAFRIAEVALSRVVEIAEAHGRTRDALVHHDNSCAAQWRSNGEALAKLTEKIEALNRLQFRLLVGALSFMAVTLVQVVIEVGRFMAQGVVHGS